MKKSTVLRLLCVALLAVAASFGVFNITAQPAQALQCPLTFLNCSYIGEAHIDIRICCMYVCPNGLERPGYCEIY